MDEHARFGGVVPEIAARAHLHAFNPVVRQALDRAGLRADQLDAVAVTTGPGLSGALQVGLAGAKTLAYALGVPLYGVHHLAGHVAADTLEHGPLPEPCVVLVVSGGHTSLLLVRDLVREPILHLGDTLDDAAGECFDKVARVFGLPYPGGPAIDRAARGGNPKAVAFPRPLTGGPRGEDPYAYSFSFSGLKTAAARWAEGCRRARRAAAGGRRRGLAPGGGGRRTDPQGGRGLQGVRREDAGGGRRSGGQLPRPGAGGTALRLGGHRTAGAADDVVHGQRGDDRGDRRPAGPRGRGAAAVRAHDRPVGPLEYAALHPAG